MSSYNSSIDLEYYSCDENPAGKCGKNRSKLESALHTNQRDPCGHTRKIVEKLHNSEVKKRTTKKWMLPSDWHSVRRSQRCLIPEERKNRGKSIALSQKVHEQKLDELEILGAQLFDYILSWHTYLIFFGFSQHTHGKKN